MDKKHLIRVLEALAIQAVVAAPALLASDGFRHFIENHPSVAVYVPVVVSIVTALAKALKDKRVL